LTAHDPRPIGVFDSGIGGLTVLRALLAELPRERFTYLGDTARLPYGTKTAATVARYSVQAADALVELGVKCLVIACNTASSVGLAAIRERVAPLPVIGVIEPGAEAACRATRTGRIAVIATERTVRGGAYQQAILEHRPDARVQALPAPLFVALAEEGLDEGPLAESAARHYLEGLFGAPGAPDTLVLGCTHFPLLLAPIRAVVGPAVQIVDSAQTTARAVRTALIASGIEVAPSSAEAAAERGAPAVRLLATDGPERFARVGGRFLGRRIEPSDVELIDL
jgi:glutamate racemase